MIQNMKDSLQSTKYVHPVIFESGAVTKQKRNIFNLITIHFLLS